MGRETFRQSSRTVAQGLLRGAQERFKTHQSRILPVITRLAGPGRRGLTLCGTSCVGGAVFTKVPAYLQPDCLRALVILQETV